MLTQCLEIKARGCCMHVFLVQSGILLQNIEKNRKQGKNQRRNHFLRHMFKLNQSVEYIAVFHRVIGPTSSSRSLPV